MNIVILTQSDPFYLAGNIEYLLKKIPPHSKIAASVVFDVSPFGKRETIFQKAKKTYDIFGFKFFMRYCMKYFKSKLDPKKNVKNILNEFNIPIIELQKSVNSRESLKIIGSYKPDLLISIAGNQIFKKPLLDLAPKGCLNLHTALLPEYRGLMPSFWVLKNNEKYTGVSVFFVDEGIDSGQIVVQKKTEIGNRTQEELIKHTKRMGMDAILESIELIEKGNYKLIENDDSKQTYFHFPTKKDVEVFLKGGKKFY